MVDRLPVVLRTDTATPRLQEMPSGDSLPTSVLGNATNRANHTGTQTLATISDARTAASHDVQTSPTDSTAGHVLLVGAFGVGAPMSVVGADGATEPGIYSVTPGPGWGWPNGGTLRVEGVAGSIFRTQFATPLDDMTYVRSGNTSGAWQSWTDVRARATHTGPLNWAWATYGGTANAIALTPAYARTAYVVGDQFRFRATAANTGATTISVGGLGVKTAVTVTGAALPAGYIRTDVDTVCVYDGTNFVVLREEERGSTANGNWVRYASGEARAYHTIPLGYSNPSNLTAVWTLPVAMASTPSFSGVPRAADYIALTKRYGFNTYGASATGVVYTLQRVEGDWVSGDQAGSFVCAEAQGRWY